MVSTRTPSSPPERPLGPARIVVGIPTVDRPSIVDQTVNAISEQTRLPDELVVSGHHEADFGTLPQADLPFPFRLLTGPKGTCHQRNRIIQTLERDDIILFLDDDFLMAPDFIAQVERLFRDHPDVVVATGRVLVDGIMGPGYDFDEGRKILQTALRQPPEDAIRPVRNGYGCNMAIRLRPVFEHDIRFDENLPLYGWFEDVDFSVRVGKYGRVVQADCLRGVHLGTKTGRTSGIRFGYSQIANIDYLRRKGTLGRNDAFQKAWRNVLSNLYHSVFQVEWIDHRGRLKGNLVGLWDLLRGCADPLKITRI